jgi:hypothetical protein
MPPKIRPKIAPQTSDEKKETSVNIFNLCEQR